MTDRCKPVYPPLFQSGAIKKRKNLVLDLLVIRRLIGALKSSDACTVNNHDLKGRYPCFNKEIHMLLLTYCAILLLSTVKPVLRGHP